MTDDKNIHTECGVFALYSCEEKLDYYRKTVMKALEMLQHRGQEIAGIAYITNDNNIVVDKQIGLVKNIFTNRTDIPTNRTLGHVKSSTSRLKSNPLDDVQPL